MREIFIFVENEEQNDRPCDIFLTGTPGIGKTALLLFFIHHLRSIVKRPVIFGSKVRPDEYHFWDKNDQYSTLEKIGSEFLNDKSIFFIMDSCNIGSTFGPRLICSSPRDSIDHQFKKTATKFYMPVWTWNEIMQCYHQIYSDRLNESRFT
jgi:Cdc6-like AAA superfamily ATPase